MKSMDFTGVIIEESLEDRSVLKEIKTTRIVVEPVGKTDATPWLKNWTMRTISIPEREAEAIAKKISESLDREHSGSWYADFKNDKEHYVIFREKIFRVSLEQPDGYREVVAYGLSLGIPKHQLDF